MLPPGLQTAREVKAHYDGVYSSLVDSGEYFPFLYPWATLGFGVVLIYLLIDHRQSRTLRSLRFPIFGFLCAFSAWCIQTNKARSAAASYGVGLISAWGTLWTSSILVFNDCQTDFRRLEQSKPKSENAANVNANGTPKEANEVTKEDHIRTQHQRNLEWQGYPRNFFWQRIDWIIDVFTNFRGLGWNFQISGIPPIPDKKDDEGRSLDYTISKTGIRRYKDRTTLLKLVAVRFLAACFALDVLKTLIQHDPYFWGYTKSPAPEYMPAVVRSSAVLTQSYRLTVALGVLYAALNQMLSLGPLFFCGVLRPRLYGLRAEPFMNPPDFYGSFTPVFKKGLGGWWGGWWHQTFRYAFEAPTIRILEFWNIDKRSNTGRFIGLFVAFFLSGCLHACGSYTQLGDNRPIMGPFRFFMLQTVGVLIQDFSSQFLKALGIMCLIPRWIRHMSNFLYAHIWLYFTAPLLVEDFAQGGVWLYEPLAFSPLRMMGFGPEGDSGWNLWHDLVFWRQGKHWWDTGIAF